MPAGREAMGVAKGSSRKRHDRARAQALRAEDARSRADAKARRHFDAVFERAINPALPPAGLAALVLDELPDSIAAARIARTRAQRAEESATPAQWPHSDVTFAPLAEACPTWQVPPVWSRSPPSLTGTSR